MLKELLDCVATVDTRVVAVERKEVVLFFYTGVQGATVPKGIISSSGHQRERESCGPFSILQAWFGGQLRGFF